MKQVFVVLCLKHGKESSDWSGRQIVVAPPKNKKDRRESGCQACAIDARAERRSAPTP